MKNLNTRRFLALMVDIYLPAIVLHYPLGYLIKQPYFPFELSAFLYIILWMCKDCYKGQSLGKYLLGIQIIDEHSRKSASPKQCIKRNIYLLLNIIECVVLVFNSEGKRLGDYSAHTEVIMKSKSK